MTRRHLPSELVALIHHVELSEAGWRDRLIDQLVLSSVILRHAPCGPEELRTNLGSEFNITIDGGAFQQSVNRLLGTRRLIEIDGCRLKLSDTTAAEAMATIAANQSLEERVAIHFKTLIEGETKALAPDDCWRRFCTHCLDPIVAELGVRTYELITASVNGNSDVRSISAYVDSYPEDARAALRKSINTFLDPADVDVRNFVLSRLHSHLLSLAASLSEQSLAELAAKATSNIQLKLFLDTNVLFSVLDLHDDPANTIVHDLIQLLGAIETHVQSTLYVFPLTVDEVTRTLRGYLQDLSSVQIMPRLGRIASNTNVGQGSGINAQFLRAAARSTYRLSAQEYLGPYTTNLLAVLKGKGVEFFNEKVQVLTGSQAVLDDIIAQQKRESTRPAEHRRKSYEALRHDITLWHFVSQKRDVRIDSPLDAVYWAVTEDYRLISFDKSKRQAPHSVPICVHPSVLIQMLQLWLPRTPQFDAAMLRSVRALLPHPVDTDVESVILRILRSLSRFEDVDDIPEDAISSVLLNRGLRSAMETVIDADEEIALVRDTLVGAQSAEHVRLSNELLGAQNKSDELEQAAAQAHAMSETLQEERAVRKALEMKADRLAAASDGHRVEAEIHEAEAKSHKAEAQHHEAEAERYKAAAQRHGDRLTFLVRTVFGILSALLLLVVGVGMLVAPGAQWLADLTGYSERSERAVAVLLMLIGIMFAIDAVGQRTEDIRTWVPFNTFHRFRNWVYGVLGTVAAGLLTRLIWDML